MIRFPLTWSSTSLDATKSSWDSKVAQNKESEERGRPFFSSLMEKLGLGLFTSCQQQQCSACRPVCSACHSKTLPGQAPGWVQKCLLFSQVEVFWRCGGATLPQPALHVSFTHTGSAVAVALRSIIEALADKWSAPSPWALSRVQRAASPHIKKCYMTVGRNWDSF